MEDERGSEKGSSQQLTAKCKLNFSIAIRNRHNQHDPRSRVGKARRDFTAFNAGIDGIFLAKKLKPAPGHLHTHVDVFFTLC